MFEDYNEGGRWVTINGKHVFIDTSKYMNSYIKGEGYKKMQKQKGDDRFEELKQMYPNATYYSKEENGIDEIAIQDEELKDEFGWNWETNTRGKDMGHYKDTTQKILNDMPVSLNMRWRDDWNYQDHQSHYIFRNRTDLFKSIKQFGGLDDMTDHGRVNYSITSQSGIGEYYLVRDRISKGGWAWEDCNGEKVHGHEYRDVGKITRKRFLEKYGQEEYDKYFK